MNFLIFGLLVCSLFMFNIDCQTSESYTEFTEQTNYTGSYNTWQTTKNACPLGYGSPTGYEPNCIPILFDYSKFRNSKVNIGPNTYSIDSKVPRNELAFKCSVTCPSTVNCNSLSGRVNWYSDFNTVIQANASMTFDSTAKEFYAYLSESVWTSYINTNIHCEIIPYFNSIRPSFTFTSEYYYAGVKCQVMNQSYTDALSSTDDTIQMTIREGDTTGKLLVCKTYLPVICNVYTANNCDLNVYLNYQNIAVSKNRVMIKKCNQDDEKNSKCDGCKKLFKRNPSNINSYNIISWTLFANMESGNLNYLTEQYYIDILSNKNASSLRSFWRLVQFPSIRFIFQPNNRPVYGGAYCFNDPHCLTFDSKYFEFHRYGEYQMYENEKLSTRMHLISKPCNPYYNPLYPFCINKIYLQSMHEVIKLDSDQNGLFYTNLKIKKYNIPLIWKNGVLLTTIDQFVIVKSDYSVEISTSYGTTLRIYCYVWGNVFYMWGYQLIPSKADSFETSGIYGNNNGNDNDDLIYLKGSNNRASDIDAFFDSYNAWKNNQLPSFYNGSYYSYEETSNSYEHDFCDCMKSNPFDNEGEKCFSGLNEDLFNDNKKRSKRSTSFETLLIPDFENLELSAAMKTLANFDLKSTLLGSHHKNLKFIEIKQRDVVVSTTNSSCTDLLMTNSILIQCNASGIIQLENLVSLCESDYNSDPTTDWVYGYLESANNKCKFVLKQDVTFFVTDAQGNKQENTVLIKNLCPNKCSNNGNCSDSGSCVCLDGFSGSDCSQDLNSIPLLYTTTYDNNTYDLSKSSLNDVILVVSQFVSDSPNAVAKCSVLAESINSSSSLTNILTTSALNFNLIYINLTDIQKRIDTNVGYFFLNLSISNNNQSFSNPITLTAYDSRSYSCSNNVCTATADQKVSHQTTVYHHSFIKTAVLISLIALVTKI